MATYIFPFLKRFVSVLTLATTNVKPYHKKNAPTYESFTAKTSKDFPLIWSFEAIKSPNLQMKWLSSALKVTLSFLLELFDIKDFESDNSEDKNYKIESTANEINLHK